jgi:methylmalonyl-CoA carboxyltransferase large subunit
MEPLELTRLADALDALHLEVAQLGERVSALEKAAASVGHGLAPAPATEALSEEIVLVLSAAIAAFLGKKAPLRQIHLLRTGAWAQQGRVTVQASHTP